MDSAVIVLCVAVVSLIVGAAATYAAMRGQARKARALERPEPVIPEAASQVLSILSGAFVVLDSSGDVLRASPLAYSYGIVRATSGDYPRLANRELVELASQISRHGGFRELSLNVPRANSSEPAAVMYVRIGTLGASRVLILADDLTRLSKVEETRRDFVANVSHELKTPVGAITLLAETMEDAAGDPEAVHRFAGRMQVETRRLSSLVQEIIELSRVQAASNLADAHEVDIDNVVAEAVALNSNIAQANDITITTGGTANLEVFGSTSMLTTAVSNLISNAIAYSPQHTHIGVSTRTESGMVEISVKDEGIGISQDNLERIFERFFRVDRARSRETGGTGLGLSIVKHIASNHGGDVVAWSKEGSGSTFTLRIPELSTHSGHDHDSNHATTSTAPRRTAVHTPAGE